MSPTAFSATRHAYTLLAALFVALPGDAGAQQLEVPDDWTWHLDGVQQIATGQEVAAGSWRYVRMPPGWHITTTEKGVSLFPRNAAVEGAYGVEVQLYLFPKPADAPFGIIVGPASAGGAAEQLRFLFRRDGAAALVAVRAAGDSVLVDWRTAEEVPAHTGSDVVRYVLRVLREGGTYAFVVNGHEMFRVPAGGEAATAVPGLRVGPGLNVHVARFDLITPLAPPRRPAAGS